MLSALTVVGLGCPASTPSSGGTADAGTGDSGLSSTVGQLDGSSPTSAGSAGGTETTTDVDGGSGDEGSSETSSGSGGADDEGPWTYSNPADMGKTGGNIVIRLVYDQVSIVDKGDRQRIIYQDSPDDAYTVTGERIPDGLELVHNVEDKRIFILGTPTAEALAMSPYETVVTLSNSTDERVIRYSWVVHDGVIPAVDTLFRPCGGNPAEGGTLWSWAWAGAQQQHLTTRETGPGPVIERMEDLSGNDHFYFTDGEVGHATEVGYTWRDYYTPYPTVGLDFSTITDLQFFSQSLRQNGSLDADGEFYLAAAVMNTRTGGNGNREIFGSSASENVVTYAQGLDGAPLSENGRIFFQIDGQGEPLMPKGSYGNGPLLVEFWRDADDTLTVFVNGVDKTQDGVPPASGLFGLSGLSSTSVSGFDDAGFEYVVCRGLPDAQTREDTREYLRKKWKMF